MLSRHENNDAIEMLEVFLNINKIKPRPQLDVFCFLVSKELINRGWNDERIDKTFGNMPIFLKETQVQLLTLSQSVLTAHHQAKHVLQVSSMFAV